MFSIDVRTSEVFFQRRQGMRWIPVEGYRKGVGFFTDLLALVLTAALICGTCFTGLFFLADICYKLWWNFSVAGTLSTILSFHGLPSKILSSLVVFWSLEYLVSCHLFLKRFSFVVVTLTISGVPPMKSLGAVTGVPVLHFEFPLLMSRVVVVFYICFQF